MLLSASLAWGFNSAWILEYGFKRYDVSETTQLSSTELENIAGDWVRYINSSDEYWKISLSRDEKTFELFTQEEQIHFRDVKNLILLDYTILIVSFCLFLVFSLVSFFAWQGRYRSRLFTNIIWGSGLTLLLTVILGAAFALNFEALFIQLHHLVFTNTFWSASGYMLLLFPGNFWFDAAVICVAFMIIIALIMGFTSLIYLKKSH